MAKSIGETLQTDEEPVPVGQAVEGTTLPDDEVTRSPAFKANLEWLKDPTNMMTAIVFLGSVIQPKDPGRNTGQTIAQRGLGALAFRGALGEGQRREGLEADEAARRKAALEAETEFRKGQLGVAQEQVAATRENTAQDAATAQMMAGLQAGVAGMDDNTRRWLAMLEADTARKLAQLTADSKTGGWFPVEEISKQAIDLYNGSLNSDTPLDPQRAFWTVARPYVIAGVMAGKPEATALLRLTEVDIPKPGAEPAAPVAKTPPKPKEKPDYKKVPQPVPMWGLPDYRLGASVGTGSHTAPPSQPKGLYPGKK